MRWSLHCNLSSRLDDGLVSEAAALEACYGLGKASGLIEGVSLEGEY
jgi:hypothetical protein